MMTRPPLKVSGLVRMGAIVPSDSPHASPDENANGLRAPEAVSSASTSVAVVPGRDLRQIPVALIDANPLAPREVYTVQMVSAMAAALREQGQHDPIHVIPDPVTPGRYVICDGWTRVRACVEHNLRTALLAEVHARMTMQEAAWFGYQQNEARSLHCDLDRAFFYEKLIAAGESASEIARRAKISESLMTFYRAYGKLPPEILEVIRQNPQRFGALVGYSLARMAGVAGARRTLMLANRYLAEEQPVRWLTNQVQEVLNPAQDKAAQVPSKQVRYVNGYYKQSDGAFELRIKMAADRKDAFAVALEHLLDEFAEQPPA